MIAAHEAGHCAMAHHHGAERVWIERDADFGWTVHNNLPDEKYSFEMVFAGQIAGIVADVIFDLMRTGVHPDSIGRQLVSLWNADRNQFLSSPHAEEDRMVIELLLTGEPSLDAGPIIERLGPVILDFLCEIDLQSVERNLHELKPGERLEIVDSATLQ